MKLSLKEALDDLNVIAIVGGSPVKGKIGNTILENIVKSGFQGKIYVINPKYSEVLGFKSYGSLKELPEAPDAVVVAIPASMAVQLVGEAVEVGVKLAVIISSGFSEVGRSDLQEALEEIIRASDIRVIGPNSAGVFISRYSLHASIEFPPTKGKVGVAAQSGAVGGVVISELKRYSSGASFFVSLGNSLDVSVEEVLEYSSEDEGTEAVITYLEWLRDGKRFIEGGLKLLRTGKPLCILKGGVDKRSSEAARSHTGGLTPNFEVFKAAVSKVGGYLATDIPDAVEVCELSRRFKDLNPSRVLVLTNSGGLGVLTASNLELQGFELPRPPRDLTNMLRDYNLQAEPVNPIDLGGDTYIEELTDLLLLDMLKEYYDVVVLAYVPTAAESPDKIAGTINNKAKDFSLPVIGYFAGEGSVDVITRVSGDIPVATSSWFLSRALAFIREFNSRRRLV
ncbi:MAG: CoA-binding protein [Zestosphaera sp.]